MRRTIQRVLVVATTLGFAVGCSAGGDAGLVSASHGAADGGQQEDAYVPPPPPGCTYTQGFWKTHPEAWPDGFVLEIGGYDYDAEELLAILWTPTRGDASMILAHQLIAAILNGGLYDPNIDDIVADALAWMDAYSDGELPYGIRGGSIAHRSGTYLADKLAGYNEGHAGTPHCDTRATYVPGDYSDLPGL